MSDIDAAFAEMFDTMKNSSLKDLEEQRLQSRMSFAKDLARLDADSGYMNKDGVAISNADLDKVPEGERISRANWDFQQAQKAAKAQSSIAMDTFREQRSILGQEQIASEGRAEQRAINAEGRIADKNAKGWEALQSSGILDKLKPNEKSMVMMMQGLGVTPQAMGPKIMDMMTATTATQDPLSAETIKNGMPIVMQDEKYQAYLKNGSNTEAMLYANSQLRLLQEGETGDVAAMKAADSLHIFNQMMDLGSQDAINNAMKKLKNTSMEGYNLVKPMMDGIMATDFWEQMPKRAEEDKNKRPQDRPLGDSRRWQAFFEKPESPANIQGTGTMQGDGLMGTGH